MFLSVLLWLTGSPHAVVAQSASGGQGVAAPAVLLMDKPADVVIFVKSLSADMASIGVAYNSRVRHESVKDDLRRLLSATGWTYRGDLLIDDASARPDDVRHYPLTTGALLTVTHAPQVRNGAPELLPYLQAFQAFSHVEVNFALPDLQPYNGVDRYESKALSVELHKDQGIYRYETEIRDHSDSLPALTPATNEVKSEATPTLPAAKPAPTRFGGLSSGWLIGAVAVLGGVLVGGAIYVLLGRRDQKSMPVHSPLRR